MEPTFKILSPDVLPENSNLFAEINLWGVTYVVTGNDNNCLALISYHFPADTNFERAAVYIKQAVSTHDILQQQFNSITISYAYPVALLVPNALMPGVNEKKILELVHGDVNDAYVRAEFSYKQQSHTIYAVPKSVDAVVSYLFPEAVIRHQFGLLSDVLPVAADSMYCIFGNNQFTVQLSINGNIHLMQSFVFKTPEDAAYYLLQICTTHGIAAKDVLLQLTGMIDADSPLYSELYKYFLQINLQPLPPLLIYPEEINSVPAHYFSHLFQMVLCV